MSPTLYRLIFKKNNCGDYDVYQQHRCQELGCFWTDEKYLSTCTPGHIDEYVEDYEKELLEGEVYEVVVE